MQPQNNRVPKMNQGDVWSSLNRILRQIHRLYEVYSRILFMESINPNKFDYVDIKLLIETLKFQLKHDEIFEDWYLRAEDIVKQ